MINDPRIVLENFQYVLGPIPFLNHCEIIGFRWTVDHHWLDDAAGDYALPKV